MADPGAWCRACGASRPDAARFCPQCGRPVDTTGPLVVELAPLGGPTAAEQRATVATRPPDRRRLATGLAAVVVVALVALGLTALLSDDGDAGPDAAPAPSTTAPVADEPTTVPATSTTASSTTTSTSTTTTVPATTTTIPFVNQRRGLVLDEAQRERSIYLADQRQLTRIDLATGRVTTVAHGLAGGDWGITATDDRLIVGGYGSGTLVRTWPKDLARSATIVPGLEGFNNLYGAQAVDATGVWAVRFPSGPGAPTALRRVDLDGRLLGEVVAPVDATIAGFLGSRVVLQRFGQIWTMGLDGAVRPYASGTVVAIAGSWVLWIGCDAQARCTYRLGTPAVPDTGRTSLETSTLLAGGADEGGGPTSARMLAPDAATVVATVINDRFDGRTRIVDLATGSTLDLAGPGQWYAWTPDGDWLVEVTLGGELVATNVRTGRRVTIAHPGLLDLRNNQYVLAIG